MNETIAIPTLVSQYGAEIANCRPNGRGTGCAMRCRMFVAQDKKPGYLMMEVARQKTIGSRQGASVVFPTFDWEDGVWIKLGLPDLAQMIMVFRGMQESVMDGKGLFHRSERANTIIKFSHQIEPRPGYLLEISTKPFDGEQKSVYFIFTPEDAVNFSIALEGAMPYLMFGIPRENPYVVISANESDAAADPVPAVQDAASDETLAMAEPF